jgi:hypothetical protein
MRGGDGERAALAARHGLADTAVHSTNRTMVHIHDAFDDGGTDHARECLNLSTIANTALFQAV